MVSYGELLSSQIIAARFKTGSVDSVWKDARELIVTSSDYGNAPVDFAATNQKIETYFAAAKQQVFIVPGFIASKS